MKIEHYFLTNKQEGKGRDESRKIGLKKKILIPGVVGQIQFSFFHVEAHARSFGHHFHVDGLTLILKTI